MRFPVMRCLTKLAIVAVTSLSPLPVAAAVSEIRGIGLT
jgi:hypothetical protein